MPTAIDEEKLKLKTSANQPFDMHKPPLKNIPHMDYPKMLYLWPKDKSLHPSVKTAIANNDEEEKSLLRKGFRLKPHKQEFPDELPEGFEADIPKSAVQGERA